MNNASKINLTLLVMILAPILMVGNHYINLVEFYLYGVFITNYKKFSRNEIAITFFRYGILFTMVIFLTSFMSGKFINNHDISILRNCGQLGIGILLFQHYFKNLREKMTREEVEKMLYKTFFILFLPVLLVFLQKMNLFNIRDIVFSLYRPKFHYLQAEVFTDYRYTSVFQDFFTSAVYYIALVFSIVVFVTQSSLVRFKKILLWLLVVFTFIAQVYVARTGLIGIPLVSFLAYLFGRKRKASEYIRIFLMAAVFSISLYFLMMYLIQLELPFNQEWVTETSSFEVMQQWYGNFLERLFDNPMMLFVPNHEYDLVQVYNPDLFSDSFYVQETYRYGIYGLGAFFYLCFSLLIRSRKSNTLLGLLTIILMCLNYKGGNTFFMMKTIYLLSFIFVFISLYNKEEASPV